LEDEFALGNYEALMFWNAGSNLDFSGSYFGAELVAGDSAENFYQRYYFDVKVVDMEASLYPQI